MADDAKKIHRCGRCGDQLVEHGSHLPGLFRCSDGTDTPWADFRLVDPGVSPDVIRQVAASSFGTPEATALRNSVTDEQVERVMRHVRDRPMADTHLTDDEREALKERVSLGGMPGPDGDQFWWTSDVLLFDAVDRLLAARVKDACEGIATAIEASAIGPGHGLGEMDAGIFHAARIARDHAPKED